MSVFIYFSVETSFSTHYLVKCPFQQLYTHIATILQAANSSQVVVHWLLDCTETMLLCGNKKFDCSLIDFE